MVQTALRRSGKATASLICGLLSFVPLISIPAVILGHRALSDIRRSYGRLGGGQFAVTALVFGYLGLLWTILFAVAFVYSQLHPPFGEGWGPAAGLRTISSAADMYSTTYSNGYPPSLEALGPNQDNNTPSCDHAGLLDQVQASGLKGGYKFTYVAQMPDEAKWSPSAEAKKHGCTVAGVLAFSVIAEPVSQEKHLPSYFVDQTGVIRVSKHGRATAKSPSIGE